MSSIKAIETRYKGYRFRSRLEARWAVFFDAFGVPWEYEQQGYTLPSGLYLPDFLLGGRVLLEVKPPDFHASDRDASVWRELIAGLRIRAFVLVRGVPTWRGGMGRCSAEGEPHPVLFAVCSDCGSFVVLSAQGLGTDRKESAATFFCRSDCKCVAWRRMPEDHPALRAATGARFEHGENVIQPCVVSGRTETAPDISGRQYKKFRPRK